MRVRHALSVLLVGIAILTTWTIVRTVLADGPDPNETEVSYKYIVIMNIKDEGTTRIIPLDRHVEAGDQVKILNLTGRTLDFNLEHDPYRKVPVLENPKFELKDGDVMILHVDEQATDGNYPYRVLLDIGGGYAGPRFIIP